MEWDFEVGSRSAECVKPFTGEGRLIEHVTAASRVDGGLYVERYANAEGRFLIDGDELVRYEHFVPGGYLRYSGNA